MTYSARDIHQLDQAYPDAVADIDEFIGNPANKRRLAEVGPEVFAAEQTRDLAYSTDNPMSLAGWAAVATTRLMETEKVWQDDTEQAWAKVDELTAELAKTRDALTEANRQRTVAEATSEALKRDNEGYADENLRLREQVFAQKPVLEAAQAWAEMCEDGGIAPDDCRTSEDALVDAVEQYRLMDLALTNARAEVAS